MELKGTKECLPLDQEFLNECREIIKKDEPWFASDEPDYIQCVVKLFNRGAMGELRRIRQALGGETSGDAPEVEDVRVQGEPEPTSGRKIWTKDNPKSHQPT